MHLYPVKRSMRMMRCRTLKDILFAETKESTLSVSIISV